MEGFPEAREQVWFSPYEIDDALSRCYFIAD